MSEFYLRKLRTFFHHLDYDNDGSITKKDFEDAADRFIARGTLSDAKGVELKEKLVKAWEGYFKNPNGDEPLSKEDCVAWFAKQNSDSATQDKLRITARELMKIYFSAIDSNNDGQIQKKEFVVFFEIFAIDKALAPATFDAIDTDGDGKLSLDEFVAAGTEFFIGEDDTSLSQFLAHIGLPCTVV